MNRTLLFCLAMCAALLFSCDKENDPRTRVSRAVLNITDARSLALVDDETKSGGRIAADHPRLYKITMEGNMEEVQFVNADGSPVDPKYQSSQLTIREMIDINDSYFIMMGSFFLWDSVGNWQTPSSLLVRKRDGALFDLAEWEIFTWKHTPGESVVKEDGMGNLYYANAQEGVTKITVNDDMELSKINYLPTGQTVTLFNVDNEGNCIYDVDFQFSRLRNANGGITELPSYSRDFWIGSDRKIYRVTQLDNVETVIQKCTVVDDGLDIESVWSDQELESRVYFGGFSQTFQISKPGAMVFLDLYGDNHWEFNESTKAVTFFDLPSLSMSSVIINSDSHIYIANGTNFYKVDINTYDYVSFINAGQYEIYSMAVNEEEVVQFNALRYSDGKLIFGEIDANGTVTILDEELDKKATILQRLN